MLQTLLLLIGMTTPSSVLSLPQVLEAQIEIHDVTLQEKAGMVAESFGISTTTFASLIQSESSWNPEADNGYDRGLVQISRVFHPEVTDEQAFSPDFALNWAAQQIKDGNLDSWTSCNCYLMTKTFIPDLPKMKYLTPNSPLRKGAVAIYDYKGIPHYAYVTSVQNDPIYGHTEAGSNLKPCELYKRFVPENNPYLVGYWFPLPSPYSQNLAGKSGL